MSNHELHAPPRINIVSAPCGSGKTYATCNYIAKQQRRKNCMYVAPSIKLLKQTKEELESKGLTVDMITNQSHPRRVMRGITSYLNNCDPSGSVLLITWASYQVIPHFNRNDNWRIFVDEVPQVDQFFEINLQQHIDELLKYIKLGEAVNETLSLVVPVNEGKLKRLIEKPDDFTKVLLEFFKAVLSPNIDVFVDLKLWTRIAEYQKFNKERDSNRIYFISMLNPKLFNHTVLLGANLQDSILYRWFSQYHQVQFVPKETIISGLRYTKHSSIGERLRIQYLLKKGGYSKYLANKKLKGSKYRWIDGMDEAALRVIKGRKFIYAVNHDYDGRLLKAEHGTQIPVISHGMNCYQDETLLYFAPSLNRSPQHLSMLNQLGIDDVTIKNATVNEVAYQALMRTALRKIDSDEIVECIVPEYETAARLASLFGEASIKWVGNELFEKKKPMTGTERNRRCLAKKRREKRGMPFNNDKYPIETTKGSCHDNVANSMSPRPLMYTVTFHFNKYAKDESHFEEESFTPKEFIREMRAYSKDEIEEKTDNIMINATVFKKTTEQEGLRKQANFVESSFMMLDFDNGSLSIDDFVRIFWEEAGRGNKRSFFIFNSFSRSKDEPNRFRVCLLYKEPATSLEAHQAVYDSIVERLKANDYDEESAELDRQCRTGNQSFYMPVTNANQKEWYHFKTYGCSTRDIERYGIVPSQYLRTAINNPSKVVTLCSVGGASNKSPLKKSIDEWKDEIGSMVSGRRRKLFTFGLCMASEFKLSADEVLNHLLDVANGSHGMEENARGVMESLSKDGYFKSVA